MRITPIPSNRIRERNPELLDEVSAADVLHVTSGTLSVWRSTGRYKIPFLKIGRNVRYRRCDLDDWLRSRLHANGVTGGEQS